MRLPRACRRTVASVTDYMERALPARRRRRFERHVARCRHCTRYVLEMATTVALLARLRHRATPEPAKSELLRTFRDSAPRAGA